MKRAQGYFLLAGLGLILLVNAIVLAGVAWNRQEPADSRLQLSERELSDSYGYVRRENSGIGLSLDYRWPSVEGDALYSGVSPEQMAVLGFWLPAERDEVSIRRYRRQQEREALLVLELDGPAYRREVQLAQTAQAEAQRLQQLAPDNPDLQRAARQAEERLLREQHAASRLLVVDVGADLATLRARYADRQRYAIVRGHVRSPTAGSCTGRERALRATPVSRAGNGSLAATPAARAWRVFIYRSAGIGYLTACPAVGPMRSRRWSFRPGCSTPNWFSAGAWSPGSLICRHARPKSG